MSSAIIIIYINITSFAIISQLEKDHSMIKTRRLKNVVIFFQAILSFVLSRRIVKIYNDIAPKHGNVTVKNLEYLIKNMIHQTIQFCHYTLELIF